MHYHYKFRVQEAKQLRVIVDTDAACEADDPFAIAHALMTPRFQVRGVIAEQFGGTSGDKTVERSYGVIQHVMELMGVTDVPIYRGAEHPLETEDATPPSEAADFIIREAQQPREDRLYVLCMGAITNVAIALNKCPEIASKLIIIWIGGGFYPKGGWEFNLMNDYRAANVVFKSQVELWQVPMECYTQMQVGYAELECKVEPCGEIGHFLFEQMQELGMSAEWISGECWSLGDSPSVGLALNPGCGWAREDNAPIVDENGYYVGQVENHRIRIYHRIDSRYILEDFFAKLKLNFQK